MKGQSQLFSSSKQDWSTPQWLFNTINNEFRFTLDAAADDSNHLCDNYFTKEQNGLAQSWKDQVVFINPEYKDTALWIRKACDEYQHNWTTSVLLIPARTDVKHFHEVIAPNATQIRFLKGRLKFSNSKDSAPFPSALIIFSTRIYEEKVIWVDYRK